MVQGVATGSLGEAYFDVSADGTLVYLPGSDRQAQLLSLVWVRPDGTVDEELVQGDIVHPQIAPDGRRWLVRTSRTELVVGDLAGGGAARELLSGRAAGIGAGPSGARLSPDGDRLAYALLIDPVAQISTPYVAEYADMQRRLPISENLVDNGYAWGPDGRLWYAEQTDNTMRVVSFTDGPDLEVTSIDVGFSDLGRFWPERGFAIAPDGRLLMIRGARKSAG